MRTIEINQIAIGFGEWGIESVCAGKVHKIQLANHLFYFAQKENGLAVKDADKKFLSADCNKTY